MKLTHFGILTFLIVILSIPTHAASETVYVYYLSNETPVVQIGVTTTTCALVLPTLPKTTTTTLKPFIIPKITLPSTTSTTRRPLLPLIIPIFLQKTTTTAATTTTVPFVIPKVPTTTIKIVVITLPAATSAATTTTLKLPYFITLPAFTTTTAPTTTTFKIPFFLFTTTTKKAATTTLPHITLPTITTSTTLPRPRTNNNLVTIGKFSFTNCQCMPTTYEFNVKNTGNFTEVYTFSVEPYPKNYYFFDQPFAMLGPGKSMTGHLYVVLPCDKIGNYEAAIVSTAEYSKQQTRAYFYLNSIKCHDYNVSIGQIDNESHFASLEQADICLGVANSLAVQIHNNGDYLNLYRLDVKDWKDIPWVALSNTTIIAPARSAGYTELNLTPKAEGNYSLSIGVKPALGTDTKAANLIVKASKCYDYTVTFEKDYDKVCCGQYHEYNLAVQNRGKFPETYELQVIKPSWAELSQSLVEVEPNSTAEVQLQVAVPCNTTSAAILVNSSNSGNTSIVAEMSLDIIPAMDCYQINFLDDYRTAHYGYSTVPFRAKNTGSDWASYKVLGIEGIGDWAVSLTDTLNLSAGETGAFWIAANATPDIPHGYYPFKIYIETSTGEQYSQDLILKLSEKDYAWQEFKRFVMWIENDMKRLQKRFFPSKTDALLYYEWKMDTPKDIELTTLFYDPDMDMLNFTVTPMEHIQAVVEGTKVLLLPAEGWTGTEKMQITADDGKGGVVTTPDITLTVVS